MTDTQADLTERARALLAEIMAHVSYVDFTGEVRRPFKPAEIGPKSLAVAVTALRSEREAERAEARRAAGQWHGHRYSEFQDQLLHQDMNKVTRARIEGQMLAHNESAKHFGAIASPAPQEERR